MKTFDPASLTDAPLQMKISHTLEHHPEEIWPVLSDHRGMTEWLPMLSSVEVTHKDAEGGEGLGCQRVCQFGPDTLHETIVHWDPPRGYAYRISDNRIVKEHLAYVQATLNDDGTTTVTWRQHFHPQGNAFQRLMNRLMMPRLLKKGLKNLAGRVAVSQRHAA